MKIITALTGRTYDPSASDVGYLLQKGAGPMLRGLVWSLVRLRPLRGFMLGANTTVFAAGRLRMGWGVSIGRHGYIDCNARQGVVLGDRVTIREYCWIQCRSGLNPEAEGMVIGQRTYIGPFAIIGAGGLVSIGSNTQIGGRLTISAEEHSADEAGRYTTGRVNRRGVSIGDDCWLGNNVTILDGVRIGNGAVIGANSLVTRDIPDGAVAYGTPARVVR